MDKLTIDYKFTEKMLIDYYVKQELKNLYTAKSLLMLIGGYLVMLVFLVINSLSIIKFSIIFFLCFIIVELFSSILNCVKTRNYIKSMYKVITRFKAEHQNVITTEGITRRYGNGDVMEKWDEIYGYYETKYLYVIKLTQVQEFYLPKSAFKTQEEKSFFVNCLNKIETK